MICALYYIAYKVSERREKTQIYLLFSDLKSDFRETDSRTKSLAFLMYSFKCSFVVGLGCYLGY